MFLFHVSTNTKISIYRQTAISNPSALFFGERFVCWILFPMCQRGENCLYPAVILVWVLVTSLWRHRNLKNMLSCFKLKGKWLKNCTDYSFSWETTKTAFLIKIDNSVTSNNSEWRLVTSSGLENAFLWFKV